MRRSPTGEAARSRHRRREHLPARQVRISPARAAHALPQQQDDRLELHLGALDRVAWQSESHNGVTARRTHLSYLGPSDAVISETHSAGSTGSKRNSLDAGLQRVGISSTSGGARDRLRDEQGQRYEARLQGRNRAAEDEGRRRWAHRLVAVLGGTIVVYAFLYPVSFALVQTHAEGYTA